MSGLLGYLVRSLKYVRIITRFVYRDVGKNRIESSNNNRREVRKTVINENREWTNFIIPQSRSLRWSSSTVDTPREIFSRESSFHSFIS